jgi:general stress protein 26
MPNLHRANIGYIPMNENEIWTFLDRQKVTFVALVSDDDKPHNTPVWYAVHNKKIYFRTPTQMKKVEYVKQNPWVSSAFNEGEKYTELRGTILGKAAVVLRSSLKEQINGMIAEKYSEKMNFDQMPARWRERWERMKDRSIIDVSHETIATWHNSKWIAK